MQPRTNAGMQNEANAKEDKAGMQNSAKMQAIYK